MTLVFNKNNKLNLNHVMILITFITKLYIIIGIIVE